MKIPVEYRFFGSRDVKFFIGWQYQFCEVKSKIGVYLEANNARTDARTHARMQHFLENCKSILFCVKKKFMATFVEVFHFHSILDRHLPFFSDQMTSFLGKTVSDRKNKV